MCMFIQSKSDINHKWSSIRVTNPHAIYLYTFKMFTDAPLNLLASVVLVLGSVVKLASGLGTKLLG